MIQIQSICVEKNSSDQFNMQLSYMPDLSASYKKLKIVLNIKGGAKNNTKY